MEYHIIATNGMQYYSLFIYQFYAE